MKNIILSNFSEDFPGSQKGLFFFDQIWCTDSGVAKLARENIFAKENKQT